MMKKCVILFVFLFLLNRISVSVVYENSIIDTIIISYSVPALIECPEYTLDTSIPQIDSLYVEIDSCQNGGLSRRMTIVVLPDSYSDSIDNEKKRLVKDYAIKTRNTYLENLKYLDTLMRMPPDSICNYYFIVSTKKCIVENKNPDPCLLEKTECFINADNYNASMNKYLNKEVLIYECILKDKVSALHLQLFYDSQTLKYIDGGFFDLYYFYENDSIDEPYSKLLDMDFPAFFNNTPLSEDEKRIDGYVDNFYVNNTRSYFYERDKKRLMEMNMNDAIEQIGNPVGSFIFKSDINRKYSYSKSVYVIDKIPDSISYKVESPIYETLSFQDWLVFEFRDKIPDILELTWLRSQNIYLTVYYIQKGETWVPLTLEFWSKYTIYD